MTADVAADVRRRIREHSIHPPPYVGSYGPARTRKNCGLRTEFVVNV
jgi:hypothetical protein